ncbi:MAG: hypothetical protein IJT73_02750 [Selenomonadaceae bacterium]|nr:hypothetical protein [Selenomonadaceae bacterium]
MKMFYVPSESMTVQGKENEIYKKYGKEWNIQPEGWGNGNWLLTKPSDVIINGKSYRHFVLDHYGKFKLTEKLADKFFEDIKIGKIKLPY